MLKYISLFLYLCILLWWTHVRVYTSNNYNYGIYYNHVASSKEFSFHFSWWFLQIVTNINNLNLLFFKWRVKCVFVWNVLSVSIWRNYVCVSDFWTVSQHIRTAMTVIKIWSKVGICFSRSSPCKVFQDLLTVCLFPIAGVHVIIKSERLASL